MGRVCHAYFLPLGRSLSSCSHLWNLNTPSVKECGEGGRAALYSTISGDWDLG